MRTHPAARARCSISASNRAPTPRDRASGAVIKSSMNSNRPRLVASTRCVATPRQRPCGSKAPVNTRPCRWPSSANSEKPTPRSGRSACISGATTAAISGWPGAMSTIVISIYRSVAARRRSRRRQRRYAKAHLARCSIWSFTGTMIGQIGGTRQLSAIKADDSETDGRPPPGHLLTRHGTAPQQLQIRYTFDARRRHVCLGSIFAAGHRSCGRQVRVSPSTWSMKSLERSRDRCV